MNDKFSDEQLREKFGMRETTGIAIDEPQELGYRCPQGHSNLTWSEFEEHIWCFICQKDFHYADDCVLIEDKWNPKNLPKSPRIIKGINNYDETGNYFLDIPINILNPNPNQ